LFCDICRTGEIVVSEGFYRCGHVCNYDICKACYTRRGSTFRYYDSSHACDISGD
jgi:hypothetical protein